MTDYNPTYVFQKNFYLLGVKLVLENSKGEILVLKRSDKVSRAHGWDLPGGAVDAHEAPNQAIVRELHEETGLTITQPVLYYSQLNTKHPDDAVILGYYAKIDDDNVAISWEHETFEWIAPDKLLQMELPKIYAEMIEVYVNK